MIVLGIDPGATTGWCEYDTELRRPINSGTFEGESDDIPAAVCVRAAFIVIEKPQGYGPTRPEMVDCGIVSGQLHERMRNRWGAVHWMTRREIKNVLTAATQRDVVVTDDASAWAAVKLLHTENADVPMPDKKGGALYGVKSHERAALAVAVAWAIKNEGNNQ